MNISLADANFRLFSMCDLLIVIFAKSNFLHYKILQTKMNYSILQHVLSHWNRKTALTLETATNN